MTKATDDRIKRYSKKLRGRKISDETRQRQSRKKKNLQWSEKSKQAFREGHVRHNSLELPNCGCWVHRPWNGAISSLTWVLADFLTAAGFEIVIPEAKMGRYTVDVLLAEEWIALEADGTYWHTMNEKKNPGYKERRDSYLEKMFNLPVIHLSEEEVNILR